MYWLQVTGGFVKRLLLQCPQLEQLGLLHCLSLCHDSVKRAPSLTSLRTLMLSGDSPHFSVRDAFLQAIIGHSALRVIVCTNMRAVTGSFLLDVPPAQLQQLERVTLSHTSAGDDVFVHLARSCPKLSRMAFEWCMFPLLRVPCLLLC